MRKIIIAAGLLLALASCQQSIICQSVEDFMRNNPNTETVMRGYCQSFNACNEPIDIVSVGYEKQECNRFSVRLVYTQCCGEEMFTRQGFGLFDEKGKILIFQNE
jgi:hypothetical protein